MERLVKEVPVEPKLEAVFVAPGVEVEVAEAILVFKVVR